ncbi:DUF6461 domain-containing protein [Nonomuraea sp. NPDC049637]|uniref:DUF6461 domain-containing protein n=1 Tax=Nonomuraea sp. NPDC049637 TaxID=3154356 RepID=UPI0034185558
MSFSAGLTDVYKEFDWLATYGPFHDVSYVSFARSLTPREALTRLGAGPGDIEQVTFDGLQERTMECIDADHLRGGYVGALETAGWTVLVQLWTPPARCNRLLPALSHGTEVVSIERNLHADDHFTYATDGEQITRFNHLSPHARMGSDPDRLLVEMREVGLDPDHDRQGPGIHASFQRSFALAKKLTGFAFSRSMLDSRFLAIVIRNE